MREFRISKYNPLLRRNGIYVEDDWTDYSDIGKLFNGQELTFDKYTLVEQKYLQCVSNLLNHFNVNIIKLIAVELYEPNLSWYSNQLISVDKSLVFLTDCMRNKCWGQLIGPKFCIYMGWDFYLHIRCELSLSCLDAISSSSGLYLEEWIS